jgi:hypothetical protein
VAVRSESRLNIGGSIEDVWAYLSDVSRWPEWAAAVRECRVGGGAPLQVGSHLEQRVKGMFGSIRDRSLDVSAVDAPNRLEFAGKMGVSSLRWGFDLAAADSDRTDVRLWVEVQLKSLMRVVPGQLLKSMIRSVNARELAAIKSAVESPAPVGHEAPGP